MKSIAIAGGSGLVGQALISALKSAGCRVAMLVRPQSEGSEHDGITTIPWRPLRGELDGTALEGFDAVIHLGGANIAKRRWSQARKRVIRSSRVASTELLSHTIAGLERPPKCFICASAVGFYGDCGDREVNEEAPVGKGFLAEVAADWEAACQAAADADIRVINARLAMVLSDEGGALRKMLLPFQFGLGGVLGDGRQYMSWIALTDVVRALLFCLNHETLRGPVNLCAPKPVTNREFTNTLGYHLGRPTILPVPKFAARLLLGEMAEQLLFSSCRAVPHVLERIGFSFKQDTLGKALASVLAKDD